MAMQCERGMWGMVVESHDYDFESGYSTLSIVKQGELMVVANVGDSRVVLGTAFDNDAITSSSSSST
uniref:protein-serine/threonine phosphatase n=1 Tax=Zea mays TaxID=4577 RepID=A0A804PXU7_MAIZE